VYSGDTLNGAINDFFKDINSDQFGVWVYYPWANALTHLLAEDDFIEIRTNRNRNKITVEEQAILAKKKIGIIGLSVGQSVATSIALERLAGEIRIADFDVLELSNYNRIRTSLRNMGLNKAVSVAREIVEFDPYLNIVCFTDGISEENIDAFFMEGGKLDMVIEESDGLEIKILAREKAKQYHIPVLMEASERGVMDIERFDLEPDRPLLHGYLEGMDMEAAKRAKTNEEKMPFMMQIVGLDIISDKMKSSMLEIGQSLTTWPQLASAVAWGGGMTADICRRIFLNQFTKSGRYVVDISDLVNDEITPHQPKEIALNNFTNKGQDFSQLVLKQQEIAPLKVDEATITKLVSTACMAPSGGNSQPWKWVLKNNFLYLFHEVDLSTQWLDYMHRGAHISFGAALENLSLEAYNLKLEPIIKMNDEEDNLLVAQIEFIAASESYLSEKSNWFNEYYPFLNQRLTSRYIGNEAPLKMADISQLITSAESINGAHLSLVHAPETLKSMAKVVGMSERLMMTNKKSHEEFYNEIKWTAHDAETSRVGIDVRTVELTATELAGFNLARNWNVVNNLIKWGGGGAIEKLGAKMTKSSSGLALLTMPNYSKKDFIAGGRALQRVWIKANQLGMSVQPMSAAIFLFARLVHGKGDGLSDKMMHELNEIRKTHLALFETDDTKGEVFLFRLFYADEPKVTSLRKHLDDVFEIVN
jgi:molybdopterin/thiamine biosynthesis adenylyltransferase